MKYITSTTTVQIWISYIFHIISLHGKIWWSLFTFIYNCSANMDFDIYSIYIAHFLFLHIFKCAVHVTLYPLTKDSHNTGNFMPYSFRIVCGFFNAPDWTYKHWRYLWDKYISHCLHIVINSKWTLFKNCKKTAIRVTVQKILEGGIPRLPTKTHIINIQPARVIFNCHRKKMTGTSIIMYNWVHNVDLIHP